MNVTVSEGRGEREREGGRLREREKKGRQEGEKNREGGEKEDQIQETIRPRPLGSII